MFRFIALVVLLSLLGSSIAPGVSTASVSAFPMHNASAAARTADPAPVGSTSVRPPLFRALPWPGPAAPALSPGASPRAPVYTFTGTPIVTPTIDGVFTGQFVDGDGTTTPGAGLADPLAFVVQKQFDAADNVYWYDPTSSFTSWNPLIMALWLDGSDDGTFQPLTTDQVIAGAIPPAGVTGWELDGLQPFPGGFSPLGFSPFVYNDAEFIYTAPSGANNRYDNGEDIFYVGQYTAPPLSSVDSVSEFRGGQQLLLPDPNNPNGPPIAHIYIEQDANYLYFHNDFLVDADSTFYDFNGLAGDDGFIDGDGTATAEAGTPGQIGIAPAARRWFTPTDSVAWYDADDDSHWTPTLDALWLDNDGDGVYNSTLDSVIVYASGALTEGLASSVWLNPATFEFVYSDDSPNNHWDSGEDIWALSGDEMWDYNYFDNRIAWLIDGDGSATTDRGGDDARLDGDQWFDAEDNVYWYDANGDEEWTEATDALWKDNNFDGAYQAASDTIIRASAAIPQGVAAGMRLLQRLFVDGDGTASAGAGSDNAARTGQAPFRPADLVFWHDGDRSQDWTISDTLWVDDGDGIYGTTLTDTVIVSATGFAVGTAGTLLMPAAHWIGYDDGEVNYNGRYDPGEDISASNSYFAYDDLEINPNFKYDLGEDVYDRDYLEIWVYAEGDNLDARMGGNQFAPEREPALRDIGFRVHLNGIRIDDAPSLAATRVISDYDAPHGIQAAAGWGPSRGFVGPFDPAFGGFNRHYEYRLPRQAGAAGSVSVGLESFKPSKESEHAEIVAILPDCSVLIHIRWKDIRRNMQGKFISKSGNEYPSESGEDWVWDTWKWIHPPPPPPVPEPPVKNDLNDPYLPGQAVVPAPPKHAPDYPPDSFFDIFFVNTIETEMLQLELTGSSPLGEKSRLVGWQASSPETKVEMGADPTLATVSHLPPGEWVELTGATAVTNLTLPPGSEVENTIEISGTTPPTEPASDSLTFNPPLTLELVKTSPITAVMPGELITYAILYENQSQFPLRNVRITDTLPVSVTSRRGFPIDSFFDVYFQIDLPEPLMRGERGHIQITGVVSPAVQPGRWITNHVLARFNLPVTGTATSEAFISHYVRPPRPAWEKHIWINDQGPYTPAAGPFTIVAGDAITVVDRVWVTYTLAVSLTLEEKWSDSLQLTRWISQAGGVTTTTHSLTWQAVSVQPNTWHAITKTFHTAGGVWKKDLITETLQVEHASPQLPGQVVTFNHGCEPVKGVDFTWAPSGPQVGQAVTFTATYTPAYANAPVTFEWDFGDDSAGSGQVVSHTYTLSRTYSVVVTATNACETVTATHAVFVAGTPDITVNPAALAVTLSPSGTTTRTLTIGNAGTADLAWSLAESPTRAWLSESPGGGALAPAGSAGVVVTFTAPAAAAIYTTTLRIGSNDPDENPVVVPVTLTVLSAPQPTIYLPIVLHTYGP